MAGVNQERAAAASQIARTLRVWRKAAEGGADDKSKDEDEGAEEEEKKADSGEGAESKDGEEGKEGEAQAGEEKAPEIAAKLDGVGLKVFRAKKSGKEKADDIPSWAAGCQMQPNETPVQAADRVMRQRFPDGNYPKGPGSEHNKIKKYFERK